MNYLFILLQKHTINKIKYRINDYSNNAISYWISYFYVKNTEVQFINGLDAISPVTLSNCIAYMYFYRTKETDGALLTWNNDYRYWRCGKCIYYYFKYNKRYHSNKHYIEDAKNRIMYVSDKKDTIFAD